MGGFDKKILFKGSTEKDIDKALLIIKDLMKRGRYIPDVDHAVSEDVTWENFKYYRLKLNNLIETL